jgi:hypothetical protein
MASLVQTLSIHQSFPIRAFNGFNHTLTKEQERNPHCLRLDSVLRHVLAFLDGLFRHWNPPCGQIEKA